MCTAGGECVPIRVPRLGETVCQRCGLVLSDREVSEELETRAFAEDGTAVMDHARVGLPVDDLLPNLCMGTRIGGQGKAAGRQRLLNLHYNLPYRERALLKAFKEMGAGAAALGLQDVALAKAKRLFAGIRDGHGVRRGAVFRALPAACTYFAAKLNNNYRPRDMVCQAFGVDAHDFAKGYNYALDCSRRQPYYGAMVAAVDPMALTTLVLNTLLEREPGPLRAEVRRTVVHVHRFVEKHAQGALHPNAVALVAAEALVACELNGIPCQRAKAASCAGVSHVTIGRCVKAVRDSLPAA